MNKKEVKIPVTKEVAAHLRELAKAGEDDWSDIILRLINYFEEDKNEILRGAKRFYLKP
jgi:predicted CopG family antitoxin